MRIAVPDLISNSYFPAIAAVELGFFESEGLAAELELVFPVPRTMAALRDGSLDFVAGSASATLMAFPEWQGARLLVALGGCTGCWSCAQTSAPDVVKSIWHYTFPATVTTETQIEGDLDSVAAAIRAIVQVQQVLREDPARAMEVGRLCFLPPRRS
jgi:hypothetical protein